MQLDAFDTLFANAVERSFRDDAIRTAVLIDDQFPDYTRMHDAQEKEFRELERARRIYSFLHGKGLICDVQNWRTPADADLELLDKVRKSDLILLDYQLGASGPRTALRILRHLAISPHFNLVVLYTADASVRVALAAAAAMRGVSPPVAALVPGEKVLDAAAEILAEEQFAEVDAGALLEYLTEGRTPWVKDLSDALRAANLPLDHLKPLADHVGRRWVAALLADYAPAADRDLQLRCEIADPDTIWIHCGSCFVAVVGKLKEGAREDEGDYVWGHLGKALRRWRPNIYRLILSEIQNALELEAVADHETWLNDHLSLGLGLYLLESDAAARGRLTPSDIEGSAESLIDRFVDLIRRRLESHPRIATTANELLDARLKTEIGAGAKDETARHIRARELAGVGPERRVDWQKDVLPAVNAFMVSDAFRGAHITTGTVLRSPDGAHWLCASPACDLVPRQDGPVLVQMIKLEKAGNPQGKFTTGDFVVFGKGDDHIILRALESKARQPSLTTLVLPAGTRIRRGAGNAPVSISGWLATDAALNAASVAHGFPTIAGDRIAVSAKAASDAHRTLAAETAVARPEAPQSPAVALAQAVDAAATDDGGGDSPSVTPPTDFVVVSQLRSAFATRFLMAAGYHQSRVGVDFVDL